MKTSLMFHILSTSGLNADLRRVVRIWQLRGDEKAELFIVLHGGVSQADPEEESTWFDGMGFGLP